MARVRSVLTLGGLGVLATFLTATPAPPVCENAVCVVEADQSALGTRKPLLLIHGWNGTSAGWTNFLDYHARTPALTGAFKPYLVSYATNAMPLSAVAAALVADLDALDQADPAFASAPLFWVGHDMGGLVARAAMQSVQAAGPNAGGRVGARTNLLVTLATPHHGTPLANTDAFYAAAAPGAQALAAIATYWTSPFPRLYPNRDELHWDNVAPVLDYNTYPAEANGWLPALNVSRVDDAKIVAFGGILQPPPCGDADAFCWMRNALLVLGAGLFESDGVVPWMSSLFMNSDTVTYRASPRPVWGYDHAQMWLGDGTDALFVRIEAELTQPPPPPPDPTCSFAVVPLGMTVDGAGGLYSVSVSASHPSCPWSASTASSFITFPSGTTGTGSGWLWFSVARNEGGASRMMALTVAGRAVSIDQPVFACSVQVWPTIIADEGGGGVHTVSVTSNAPDCQWSASTQSPLVSFPNGTTGSGSALFSFSVPLNATGASRTIDLVVAAQVVTVQQTAFVCGVSLGSPSSLTVAAAGGTRYVEVVSNAGHCTWSADTTSPDIQFPAGTAGTGSASFPVAVLPNLTGVSRTMTATVAGRLITIFQHGPIASGSNWIQNGGFDNGFAGWLRFATPDMSFMWSQVTGGVLEFYRLPPPPGTQNQVVIFQNTGQAVAAGSTFIATFEAGNADAIRKRLTVLLHDSDFSDIAVCTFWLAPNAPLTTYQMRTFSTRDWLDVTVSIYAATSGSGGAYRLDDVVLSNDPGGIVGRTECIDPTVPGPSGGPDGPEMLVNGDFSASTIEPWFMFGTILGGLNGGMFEFGRGPGFPAGVISQRPGQSLPVGQRLTATFELGNMSSARRRVTVILHDADFSDFGACTVWLEPGQPLTSYTVRMVGTKPWVNASVSFYPALPASPGPVVRLDNVTLRRAPSATVSGLECFR